MSESSALVTYQQGGGGCLLVIWILIISPIMRHRWIIGLSWKNGWRLPCLLFETFLVFYNSGVFVPYLPGIWQLLLLLDTLNLCSAQSIWNANLKETWNYCGNGENSPCSTKTAATATALRLRESNKKPWSTAKKRWWPNWRWQRERASQTTNTLKNKPDIWWAEGPDCLLTS